MEDICSELKQRLIGSAASFSVHFADSLASTNQTLRAWAEAGAPAGTVCLAAAQTAGRGRQGRAFFSPPHAGLYLSLLLRPDVPPQDALLLTPMAAVATGKAIADCTGVWPSIKWVNDILMGDKKLAGILTEAQLTPDGKRLAYVVIGIGCNLYPPAEGYPPDLRAIAGTIWQHRPAEPKHAWVQMAAYLLNHLADECAQFSTKAFLADYRAHLCMLQRPIIVCDGTTERDAVACAVDDRLRLLVRYLDGTEEWRDSGEIRIRLSSACANDATA